MAVGERVGVDLAVGDGVGVGVGVIVGLGVGVAAGVGSKGIAVGEVDPVQAVRDASITRVTLNKSFLYQVIQRSLRGIVLVIVPRSLPAALPT